MTTAVRAAENVAQMEAPNQYGIGVSRAQGVVKGLTGGRLVQSFVAHMEFTKGLQQLETPP